MIVNGGSRRQWRRFAKHLANEKDNERVRLVEVRGMSATSIREGFGQLQAMADIAGAGDKEFYYHANANPKQHETLTEEQWERTGDKLRENLGLSDQPGMVIEHTKGGRTHRHYIDLRVNLDTGKLISDSHDFAKHQRTARELEREFVLDPVKGVHIEREGPRPERRPKNWEVQRGNRTGIDPNGVRAEVTALWKQTHNGAEFRTALAERGYLLCRGDRRDFCLIDPAGNDHSLARRIDGVKAADVRARMADLDRDALPAVSEGRGERRDDRDRVIEAVGAGADKRKIERVINAGRAADIAPAHREDEEHRDAYDRTFKRRAHTNKRTSLPEPADGRARPSWQERARSKDRELER